MIKNALVKVRPRRQPSQYHCTVSSLSMGLEALGIPPEECTPELVNKVLGALPLRGASWEQVAGAASHYGCRATLVVPSTLRQVRAWTDAGIPVLIGWNTGNEWSHASLIFDVNDSHVFIADPNIPNPDATVRVMTHDEFYEKWWEKSGEGYKVRRPAMAIEREITSEGRQVLASMKHTAKKDSRPVVLKDKDKSKQVKLGPPRSEAAKALAQRGGGGRHQTREQDVEKGRSRKEKHKTDWKDKDASYTGNPGGEPVYPHEINHGYNKPISGGTDVMSQLVQRLQHEQGLDDGVEPRRASELEMAWWSLAPMKSR